VPIAAALTVAIAAKNYPTLLGLQFGIASKLILLSQ